MSNSTRRKRNRRKTPSELSARQARRNNAVLANLKVVQPAGFVKPVEPQKMQLEIVPEENLSPTKKTVAESNMGTDDSTEKRNGATDLEKLYERARGAAESREIKLALRLYKDVLEADPSHLRARNNLALLLESEGDAEGAIAHLTICVEQDSSNLDPLINRAVVFGSCGKYTEAQKDLQEVLERDPGNSEALVNLGVVLSRKGLWSDSAEHLRRSLELDPDNAGAYFHLGVSLNQIDDLEGALQAYQHALALKANHSKTLYGIGVVLDRMNKPLEATQMYRRSRENAPA